MSSRNLGSQVTGRILIREIIVASVIDADIAAAGAGAISLS